MSELEDLESRLKHIIKTQCNIDGCKNCGMKWDGGCSATELNNQIMEVEIYKDRAAT